MNNNVVYNKINTLELVQFKNLLEHNKEIIHCFTTRKGGVSKEPYNWLNMSFNKKDARENVMENYRIVAQAIGVNIEDMVLSNQVHDNKIRVVYDEDRGKGIVKKSDITGYDGLVTNSCNVVLVTFYADCVPVFLFDPVKKAIGLVHSGWKSTLKEICKEAILKMTEEFNSDSSDIIATIGPSIGKCCFEVGEDVYKDFLEKLDYSKKHAVASNGKYFIDLPLVVKDTLKNQGLKEKNILLSHVCTKCNKDIYFSHRGDNGNTGTLAAFMKLRHN